MYTTPAHRRHRQAGITLVIGLIMLSVITLIAISVASMVTVDLKIAGNQQAAQRARAAAESGIDYLVGNPSVLTVHAPFSPATSPVEEMPATGALRVDGGTDSDWSAEVTIKRMGDPLPCPKATLPTNLTTIDSTTITKCVYFEIKSTGSLNNSNAKQTVRRGFYRKVGGFVAG